MGTALKISFLFLLLSLLSLEATADTDGGCIPGSPNCGSPTPTPFPTPSPSASPLPSPSPSVTPLPTPIVCAEGNCCPPGYTPRPVDAGVLLLEPTHARAFVLKDRAKFESTAPVWINSTHERAAICEEHAEGSAPELHVSGTYREKNQCHFTGKVSTGDAPQEDPLRFLPAPNMSDSPVLSQSRVLIRNKTLTLHPGIYRSDIKIEGKSFVTLEPGIYSIDGRLEVEDESELRGQDVLLFFTTKTKRKVVDFHSKKPISLSAARSGLYAGIVMFQKREERARLRMGGCGGDIKILGMIYAPKAKLKVRGDAKAAVASQFIGRKLKVKDSARATFNYDPTLAPIGCYK